MPLLATISIRSNRLCKSSREVEIVDRRDDKAPRHKHLTRSLALDHFLSKVDRRQASVESCNFLPVATFVAEHYNVRSKRIYRIGSFCHEADLQPSRIIFRSKSNRIVGRDKGRRCRILCEDPNCLPNIDSDQVDHLKIP